MNDFSEPGASEPGASEPIAADLSQARRIERFWSLAKDRMTESDRVVRSLGRTRPAAWSFGDSPDLADQLLALTLSGEKVAMASALWEFEIDHEPLPTAGDLAIVLDSSGEPRALIRTTEVTVVPFDNVSAEHARHEAEGDRSLTYWRAEHERCWRGTLAETSHEFDVSMLVVCERFELLYPSVEATSD